MNKRFTEYRLLGLFSAAVACVGGLLLAILWIAAVHADNATRQHEEDLVSGAGRGLMRRLEVAMAPRVTWDEAVAHLDRRFDHSWAAANLGAMAHPALGVNLTAVIDGEGQILYGVGNGHELTASELPRYAQAAASLVSAVRRAEAQRGPLMGPAASGETITYPIQFIAPEMVQGTPYMLSATLVQPNFGHVLPKGQRAAIVITGRSLDKDYVDVLGERYLLEDLQLSPGAMAVASDRARVVVRDEHGQPIATLHWKHGRPGQSFLSKAALPVSLVILGLAACLFGVMTRGYHDARRLVRSEARLQLALQAAKAGAFEIDHANQTFWCSPEVDAIIGRHLTLDEAMQVPWPCFHPEDVALLGDVSEGPRPGAGDGRIDEMRIVRPDGGVLWVRIALSWLPVAGRYRTTGLLLDIDERKRQELALVEAERAAQEAGEAKSRFLATVSHEIRTPMNGILGVLHLLKGQPLAGDGVPLVTEALACGQMLTSLIDDVLDFSKIEAGQLELSPAPVDPAAALEGVVKLLEPQCVAKGIQLETTIDAGIGWVVTDPIRLRQALFNLIGNAVKFTMAGGVHVRLMRSGEGMLRFEVADTGVGIPELVQQAVFDQFHQGDSSTTRRFGGTGLGLAITRRLARLMGGDVDFVSREGEGSTFWLELAAPPVQVGPQEEAVAPSLPPLRVLVVEDNPTNRLVVTRLLEAVGMSVQTAEDGLEGVEAVLHGAFDLILMDVQMPRMDGLEAARRIRASGGAAARTPIIALTANAMTHQRASYIEAGMTGLVAKPIAPAALLAEMARQIETAPGGAAISALAS